MPEPKKSIRILLVEDAEMDAIFVSRVLESNPEILVVVEPATTLGGAITKLQTSDYDVCMLDLSLPDADGLESFEKIRALDARLPIVVLTSSEDEDLALLAIESGAQDFIAKGHLTGQLLFRAVRFAIARQRKVMGFQAAADTDPLTGMPNRRHLESRFAKLLAQSASTQSPMSVAIFDVDHFKKVNDQYGHFVGDAVLKEVSAILMGPDENLEAARFGGEEFVIMMPGRSLDQACELVGGILKRLEETTISLEIAGEMVSVQVTASAGVIDVSEGESWNDVYVVCDVAMYEAKTSGRNRLVRRQRTADGPQPANS
jgi:diguanylate cyclase (GGDEF)-like protein